MSFTGHWSIFAIFCQTFIVVIISWPVLSCRLDPYSRELQEVTLAKLLYLYDPVACARTHFYNYTVRIPSGANKVCSAIFWPEKNDVAASFRRKIKIWLSLHLVWSILGVAHVVQRQRICGFYVTIIPFTITGIAILVVDLVFAALFYVDATNTGTEFEILHYIDSSKKNLHTINEPIPGNENDTSWIAVLFAYCSLRGIVPWFMNYWIIKDFYFDGRANYRRLHTQYSKSRKRVSGDSLNIV